MKKILAIAFLTFFIPFNSYAVWVNGHTKSNGTYVSGYERTAPDGNPYNNYSTPGNYNPNTGTITGGSLDTYINRYYNNNPTYSPSYSYPPYSYSSYGSGSGYNNSYSGSYSSGVGGGSYKTIDGGYYIGSTLFCSSGYYKNSDSCIKAPANSQAYGGESFYCDYGFLKKGGYCEAPPSNGSFSINGEVICKSGYYKVDNGCYQIPINAHVTASGWECDSGYRNLTYSCQKIEGQVINGQIVCSNGYALNKEGDDCVSLDIKCREQLYNTNAFYDQSSKMCSCPSGTVASGNSCVSYLTYCLQKFGTASEVKNDKCVCMNGYEFDGNQCAIKKNMTNTSSLTTQNTTTQSSSGSTVSSNTVPKTILTKNLSIGSKNKDVQTLEVFLKNQNYLTGSVDNVYDRATYNAVLAFQKANNILKTGTVGPLTRTLINKMMRPDTPVIQ